MPDNQLPKFFDWRSLPFWTASVDWSLVGIFLVVVALYVWNWRGKDYSKEGDIALGANAVWTQLTAGLTASSILLPASFVIIGLGRGLENPLPSRALTQVVFAACWFSASIVVAVYNASLLTRKVTQKNISGEAATNILLVTQLALMTGRRRSIDGDLVPCVNRRCLMAIDEHDVRIFIANEHLRLWGEPDIVAAALARLANRRAEIVGKEPDNEDLKNILFKLCDWIPNPWKPTDYQRALNQARPLLFSSEGKEYVLDFFSREFLALDLEQTRSLFARDTLFTGGGTFRLINAQALPGSWGFRVEENGFTRI